MARSATIDGVQCEDANGVSRTLGNAIMRVMSQMEREKVTHIDLDADDARPKSPEGTPLEKACDALQRAMFNDGFKRISVDV